MEYGPDVSYKNLPVIVCFISVLQTGFQLIQVLYFHKSYCLYKVAVVESSVLIEITIDAD